MTPPLVQVGKGTDSHRVADPGATYRTQALGSRDCCLIDFPCDLSFEQ